MLEFVITGLALGLAAGLSPGPLLAFLVSQSLRYGVREGVKVALVPLLSDAPIVALSLAVLARLAHWDALVAGISVAGGLYVGWLGAVSWRFRPAGVDAVAASPHSVRRAYWINLLNPHVYLFWIMVGGPILLHAASKGPAPAAGFVAGFYLLLCGSKIGIAAGVHRSRGILGGKAYAVAVRGLGLVLLGFAGWLIATGIAALAAAVAAQR